MLKSTFTPFLLAINPKPITPKPVLSCSTVAYTPPSVRQNASPIAAHQLSPASAYIHLPFCRKRCHYCDFTIVALGSSSGTNTDDDPRILNYVRLLCREIVATEVENKIDTRPLETVYFGGGTPSLVPPRLVSSILETLRSKFGLSRDAEISIEMDPGTFDANKLNEMMEYGVNRVSLGVQAFQQELLRNICGRAHGLKEVYEAIDIVKSCGVKNWSLDLISSLPYQTPDMWQESLRLSLESGPTHVSTYDLQVEQGTKFGALYTPGQFPLPSEGQSADYYRMASMMLSNSGYNHYEISSYCKSGFECKHNLTYWNNKPFYGFGLGSASFIGGIRFCRPNKVKDYTGFVENLENGVVNCCRSGLINLSNVDAAMDTLMLSLRTARGIDLKSFGKVFGSSMVSSLFKAYKPYIESGHVICLDDQIRVMKTNEFCTWLLDETDQAQGKAAYIRLSDPEGFLLSNELISLAFAAIDP